MTNASLKPTNMFGKILVILVGFLVMTSNAAYSYRTKSGDVSGETWEGYTYYVSSDVTVDAGETLTINAGTTGKTVVKFAPNVQMIVKGTLDVNGADGNEVVFTSMYDDVGDGIPDDTGNPTAGDWRGIHLDGSGYNDGIGEFDYCRIRYGGKGSFSSSAFFKDSSGDTGKVSCNVFFDDSSLSSFTNSISEHGAGYGVFIHTCSPTITGSTFANNMAHGMFIHTGLPKIKNSVFAKNAAHGMYIYVGSPTIEGSTFANNMTHGMHVYVGSPTITDSAFASNAEHGLYVQYAKSAPVITSNSFEDNGGYGAFLDGVTLTGYSGNTGSGNGKHGFWINGTVNASSTWSMRSSVFPFVVFGTVTVADSATLTLSPGTIIKCTSAGELIVNGTLGVNGTSGDEDDLVVFTSLKDDSYGGNTDGIADTPAAGDWRGIHLDGAGDNNGIGKFSHCRIRYGGSSDFGANVSFSESSLGNFTNSISEYSAKYGMSIHNCSPTITNSTFDNNAEHGMYIHADLLKIADSTFTNNAAHGMYVHIGSPTITNSVFVNNAKHGLYVQNAKSAPVVTDNRFADNDGYGAFLDGVTLASYSGNTGSRNGTRGFWINGTVSANSTWSTSSSTFPFVIFDSITVVDGATLTLSPGTVLKADSAGELIVNGALEANGASWDEGDFVVITSLKDDSYGGDTDGTKDSPAAGDWRGIHLDGSGDNDGIGKFGYCRIRYGGSGSFGANTFFNNSSSGRFTNSVSEYSARHGVSIYGCSPAITDSTFANNEEQGLYVQNPGSAPVITTNDFKNNGGYGAFLDGVTLTGYSGNTGSGNGIRGFWIKGTVNADSTWSMGSSTFPFVIFGGVTVVDGATLTLSAGTVIKAASAGELIVNGTLDVKGTSWGEGDFVVLTALKDDSYGGDTDGTKDSPAAGDWRGIYLNGSGDNDGIGKFDYGRIRYGGNAKTGYNANVFFNDSSFSSFSNSITEYSAKYGMSVYSCSPAITNSTFAKNAEHGLYVQNPGSAPVITGNSFMDNGGYGAFLDGVTLTSYSGNTGSGNGIHGFGVNGAVTANSTWSMGSYTFPFVVLGSVKIADGATLTLSAGTIMEKAPLKGDSE